MRIPKTPTQYAAMVASLNKLRDYAGKYTVALNGNDEILAYLRKINVRTYHNTFPTIHTLNRWITKKGFPVYVVRNKRGRMTTNLHILAWMWSMQEFKREKRRYRRAKPYEYKAKQVILRPDSHGS